MMRTGARGSDSSRTGKESEPHESAPESTVARDRPAVSGANGERSATGASVFRVIDGLGKPEQTLEWLHHDVGPEATAWRVEQHKRRGDERRAALEARPNCIYLMYDANDALLYVGISVNGPSRFKEHAAVKGWWQQVVRIELEHVDGRVAAEERELELIRTRDPVWNVMGKES